MEQHHFCEPCLVNGNQTVADMTCETCDEKMCMTCSVYHKSFKMSRNHIISNLDSICNKLSSDSNTTTSDQISEELSSRSNRTTSDEKAGEKLLWKSINATTALVDDKLSLYSREVTADQFGDNLWTKFHTTTADQLSGAEECFKVNSDKDDKVPIPEMPAEIANDPSESNYSSRKAALHTHKSEYAMAQVVTSDLQAGKTYNSENGADVTEDPKLKLVTRFDVVRYSPSRSSGERFVSSIACLSDSRLAVLDNISLTIFDAQFRKESTTLVPSSGCDSLTYITDNRLALVWMKYILFYDIKEKQVKKTSGDILLKTDVTKLTYANNRFVFVCSERYLHDLDIEGDSHSPVKIKGIGMGGVAQSIVVDPGTNVVYISYKEPNGLMSLKLDGTVLFSGYLDFPIYGLVLTGSHVIVCEGNNKSLCLFEENGQFSKNLVEGMRECPRSICYDGQKKRLFVSHWYSKTISLYKFI